MLPPIKKNEKACKLNAYRLLVKFKTIFADRTVQMSNRFITDLKKLELIKRGLLTENQTSVERVKTKSTFLSTDKKTSGHKRKGLKP